MKPKPLIVEDVVKVFLEDATGPFTKEKVTLQYRPYMQDDQWKWFWVLLPDDNSKALATGEAESRAKASVAARLMARKKNVVIGKTSVITPYTK